MKSEKPIIAVLAGNPNCGKTTLFNALTGSAQKTGNRAGVTVEKKYGRAKGTGGKSLKIADLPGLYSLYPYSDEEAAAADCLLHDKPDVVINVIDSTNIERNLYLTTQLAELDLPVVAALNMYDVIEKRGGAVDVSLLEKSFKIPFVPVSASKGSGIDSLVNKALQLAESKTKPQGLKIYSDKTENALLQIEKNSARRVSRFEAVRRLEKGGASIPEPEMTIADERYKFICSVINSAVAKGGAAGRADITEKIDKIATSRFFAIPFFILILALIFYLTFGAPGQALRGALDYIITDVFENCVKNLLISAKTSALLQSLVLDGIIGSVGSVISFLPQIAILFTLLAVLEDSGYMARAIFITDKALKRVGLSGKSFVPVILGFGCTVPAVLSTKTLSNPHEKRLAILISPFMSCCAKMPVYMLFCSEFFKGNQALVILFIYLFGVMLAVLTAVLFKSGAPQKQPPFIMELPPYRLPSAKNIWRQTWDKIRDFLTRAGTILLGATVIIWFLQSFDFSLSPCEREKSILTLAGGFIAPVFTVCGFGTPQASVSLLTGLAAKESVASTMLLMCRDVGITNIFTPLSAFSFLIFVLLYPPCIAAMSAVYKELKSLKSTAFTVLWQCLAAWLASAFIYQSGTLIQNIGGLCR